MSRACARLRTFSDCNGWGAVYYGDLEHSFDPRFSRLERLLAQGTATSGQRDASVSQSAPFADQLLAINTARINALIDEIADRCGTGNIDDMDRVIVRVLLDEYRTALGRLRAVASEADRSVRQCQLLFRDATRHLHKLRKLADASEPPPNAPLDAPEPPPAD